MITRILLSLMLTLLSFHIWAEPPSRYLEEPHSDYDKSWYIGAAYGQMTYSQSNRTDFTMSEHRLIIGKQLSRIFALEMHVGDSAKDTQVVTGIPVTVEVDNYVSGFLKVNATYAFEDWDYNRVRLFALLGGTRLQSTSTDPLATSNGTQSSVSAGIGAEVFYDNIGIQIGYTRYVNGNSNSQDYSLDSLYLGVIYQFGTK
jgi:hypothetical protein